MISQSDLFKLFRMISRRVIMCDECALRFYVCSIFVDRVFVPFIFHHGVHWTYKCFAYVAPRGWIWVRRGLCGFGDIRGSVGRYDPWGIKATGFAVTTKINQYAAVTGSWRVGAGSLVLRGPHGSRRLGRGGGLRSSSSLGRGGDHPPCLGGWGPGPPRPAGRWGGGGGGCRAAASLLPFWAAILRMSTKNLL